MTFFCFLLWICILLLGWTYLLYPIFILLLSKLKPRAWQEGIYKGKLSIIIPAYNEERIIKDKVLNSLNLNYERYDWEVIVVSDGSTDKTATILSDMKKQSDRLKIITNLQRFGKPHVLNTAVSAAAGEVLVFSDANVFLQDNAIQELISPFVDPEVGAVCGKVLLQTSDSNEIGGENLYMQFEGMVQKSEAKYWSMVGVDGALYALRRELYVPMNSETILDDLFLSMMAPLNKKRIVYMENAISIEKTHSNVATEFKRKTRIIAGGYQYLLWFLKQNRNFKASVFLMFFSHKILRWISPIFAVGIFISSIFLLDYTFYLGFFLAQILFLLIALLAHIFPTLCLYYLFYIPYYFCMLNLAATVGLIRFLHQSQSILWEKEAR